MIKDILAMIGILMSVCSMLFALATQNLILGAIGMVCFVVCFEIIEWEAFR